MRGDPRARRVDGDAAATVDAGADGAEIDDGTEPRIVKAKTFQVKPMTPQEAALQMELLGHDFFFFMSSETERATVVYRREDGDIGLIDQA